MAAPIIRNKRSSVSGKVPTTTDLSFGEFGVNTYDGKVFISASNAVVGVGTTVITINPWSVGIGSTAYNTYFNAGNVGIGTTNPQQKLHVLGNVLVAAGSSTDQHITQKPYELNNGTLSWEGSAGQLFSITNNLSTGSIFSVNDISGIPSIDVDAGGAITLGAYGGNIGVGTTNPTSKLHVVGNALVSGIVTATTFVGNLTGTATTATTSGYATTAGVSTSVIGGIGSITQLQVTGISTFTNGPVFIGAATSTGTASQPLQVTGGAYVSGNLGIGATNPTYKVHVAGDIKSTQALHFGTGGTYEAGTIYSDANWGAIIRANTTSPAIADFMITNSADVQRFRIDTSGNVIIPGNTTATGTASQLLQVSGGAYVSGNLGVGVTNPQRKLHIRALGADGIFLDNTDQTGNSGGPLLRVRGQRSDGNASQSFSGQLVLERWRMDASINSGQNLGAIIFGGNFDTLPGITTGITYGASIGAIAEGAFSNINTAPTAIVFNTGTVGLGTLILPNLTYGTEAARITSNRNLVIGSITETGTASQVLQVTGGAYVSGNLGVGTTNPTSKLHVVGNVLVSGIVTATTFVGALTGTASNVTTNANLTGHVTSVGNAAVLGSFTSAQLATALTDETGTGANVFATSPTLVTPVLGTPTSGNLANCTFPTLNQNTTGNAATVTTNANLTGDVTSVGNATSIATGVIVNADINVSAGIVDTKLATIGTAGKVSNSATTATNANTASAIVARDASGNFSAGTITATTFSGALSGNSSTTSGCTFSNDAADKADITTRTDSGFYQHDTATTAEGWPITSNTWMHMIACTHSNDANYYSMQIAASFYNNTDLYYRSTNGAGATGWSKIWNSSNDGAGSGLDADLLDGENLVDNAATANTVVGRDASANVIANDFNSTSDIKLKTNIKTLTNSLDKVLTMRGVEFDRIDIEGKHQIGFIAQEIEAIVPELVSENQGTKSVAYGNITALLVEAIKEQQQHINNLKQEIKKLKK